MGAEQGQPAEGKAAGLSSVGSLGIERCLWLEPRMETTGS